MKYIQHDPRFRILNKVSEKKQIFNAWKTQRQKEERVSRVYCPLYRHLKVTYTHIRNITQRNVTKKGNKENELRFGFVLLRRGGCRARRGGDVAGVCRHLVRRRLGTYTDTIRFLIAQLGSSPFADSEGKIRIEYVSH